MNLMNKDRLDVLEKYWEDYEEGLTCSEFIQLMLNSINTYDDEERYELMYGCFQLF